MRSLKRHGVLRFIIDLEDWRSGGQVEILSRDVPMDGRSKSSLMSSLIETADAKRRCVVTGIDCASGPIQ